MTESGSYTSAWRDRRRRLRLCFLAALGYVPVYALTAWLALSGGLQYATLACYGGVVLAVGYWASAFPCPRCHATFAGNVWETLLGQGSRDARKCAKCGLPVDTTSAGQA